jgi:hypothetical protein
MLPAGFEPTILASERPETHALNRAVTGMGKRQLYYLRQTTKTAPCLHFSAASVSLCVRQRESVSTRVCKHTHYTGLSSTRTSVGRRLCSPWWPLWRFTLSALVLKKRAYILYNSCEILAFTQLLRFQITYRGCNRRNRPNFGRVFLRSNYTDITQNTYIQSWTVTEILARENSGLLSCLRAVLSVTSYSPPTWTEFLCYR